MSTKLSRSPSRVRAMSRSSGRMISKMPPTSPTFQPAAVTSFYGLADAALSRRHDPHLARAVAA